MTRKVKKRLASTLMEAGMEGDHYIEWAPTFLGPEEDKRYWVWVNTHPTSGRGELLPRIFPCTIRGIESLRRYLHLPPKKW